MRAKEKEIFDKAEITLIINEAEICRLAFSNDDFPYVVPLNFGYETPNLYFHTGLNGKKIDMLKRNQNVCFEMDIDHELIKADNPCDWAMKYKSVVGFGKASVLLSMEEKTHALNIIMKHYGRGPCMYEENRLNRTAVIRVEIEHMTGRKSG